MDSAMLDYTLSSLNSFITWIMLPHPLNGHSLYCMQEFILYSPTPKHEDNATTSITIDKLKSYA